MIHETPSQEIFNEIKEAAKSVWINNYSDEHGYVTEKVSRIDSLLNVQDNAMVCFRMFDHLNQAKMLTKLSEESVKYIFDNK